MKKNLLYLIILLLTGVFYTSCSTDDNNDAPETTIDPVEESYTIVSETNNNVFTSIVVEYTSVAADNTSAQRVSGVITIPNGPIMGIMIDNHYTMTSNDEVPSVIGTTSAGHFLGSLYCIVAADYVGYGKSADLLHPYLCHKVCARNSIDLALIAQDILQKRGVNTDKLELYNMGYSQGGAVAMAVHREMEKDMALASRLHFTASWCGDGPYDIVATLKDYYSHPDYVSYPVGAALLIEGFMAGAPASIKGNLKFADFFTDKMIKAGLEDWINSKKYESVEINEMMKKLADGEELTMSDIFSPEMATEDGKLAQLYFKFAQLDELYKGWTPSLYPIKLIHMQCDDVVPVVNANNAIAGLGLSPDSYFIDTKTQTSHGDYGLTFYTKVVSSLVVTY